ncbi:PLP-dependent aminotransferase family protein [Lapillicoccus jejuensis]|uniref:GntR family transcriptional regulator n=1 Tax=Lapillicoccus jejuensis TaxID=402171 RepID=A0A542DVL4_9MICO|nr:PLP-dependent aminotransferase family protein [Lapillicoccus jejuensis]TQJ07118.1 GntR family transcriptional regulator [Lapillicoccus jejuensis]
MSPSVSAPRLAGLLTGGSPRGTDDGPAYRSLAEGVRRLVADGRLLAGTRLPSERELTAALGVSRTTVAAAYGVLRERGYLQSRRGSGSVVSLPTGPVPGGPLSPVDGLAPDVLDLTIAAHAATPGLAEAYEEAMAALPHHLPGTGYHPYGLPEVRELLAERYTARGLPTDPSQVLVTTGALAGLGLALRALGSPGDRALVESPSYPNAMAAIRGAGLRTVGLALDEDGLDADGLDVTLRQSAARLAYLVPDFHNPTGTLVGDPTREQVARVLRRRRTTALVDETPVDLALDRPESAMPAPMASYDDRVVTLGSAAKSYWGGLRVGWLRVPLADTGRFQQARLTLDLGAAVVEQLVLAALLRRRDELLARRREQLRASRAAMVSALAEHLPDWRFTVPEGGLCLWCRLPEPRSSALADAAPAHGLRLAPGSAFGVDGGLESFCRLPMALPPDLATEAVRRVARAWDDAVTGTPARSARPVIVA